MNKESKVVLNSNNFYEKCMVALFTISGNGDNMKEASEMENYYEKFSIKQKDFDLFQGWFLDRHRRVFKTTKKNSAKAFKKYYEMYGLQIEEFKKLKEEYATDKSDEVPGN